MINSAQRLLLFSPFFRLISPPGMFVGFAWPTWVDQADRASLKAHRCHWMIRYVHGSHPFFWLGMADKGEKSIDAPEKSKQQPNIEFSTLSWNCPKHQWIWRTTADSLGGVGGCHKYLLCSPCSPLLRVDVMSYLTNIFQMGWNNLQLDGNILSIQCHCIYTTPLVTYYWDHKLQDNVRWSNKTTRKGITSHNSQKT